MGTALGSASGLVVSADAGTAHENRRSTAAEDVLAHRSNASTCGWVALALVVVVAFVVPIVLARPMDGDEGYYAIATKLVAHGKAPYSDFWFQQAPLLVYVYGVVERFLGSSWSVLRGTSALFTILLAAGIAAHGIRRWRSPALAFLAVTLFISTPIAFEWLPTVKTYALSTLLLFGAYVAAEASSRRWWFVAGVLLGLAVDTRLLFATIAVVFALYAGRHLWSFAVGLFAGLLPLLAVFTAGPVRFVNDAVMSQTKRSHVTLASNVSQKIQAVGSVIAEPHFVVLSVATLALLVLSLRTRRRVPLVVAAALTLGITNVIPTPSYEQYFVTLVPFLVVATVDLVAEWHLSNRRVAGIAVVAIVLGALVPIGVVPASTSGVVPRTKLDVSATRAISAAIDAHAMAGEPVLSFWPGFLYESHARPVPGMESDFEVEALRDTKLTQDRAQEFHMLSLDGIVNAIKSHRTRLIVLGEGNLSDDKPWRSIIERAGYRPVERLPYATLYEYRTTKASGG